MQTMKQKSLPKEYVIMIIKLEYYHIIMLGRWKDQYLNSQTTILAIQEPGVFVVRYKVDIGSVNVNT